jgi:hypothetical protein
MPLAYIFWMLMILWAIFGLGYPFVVATPDRRIVTGGNVLLFVLLLLLGMQVFGNIVK